MSERVDQTCPTCHGVGYLPLDATARESIARGERAHANNGEWLECSDCGTTGVFTLYEHKVVPPVHTFLNGLRSK